MSNIPQKQHTIPADVLPNDSEELFKETENKQTITDFRALPSPTLLRIVGFILDIRQNY